MLTGELAAGTGAAAHGSARLDEIYCGYVVALSAAGAFAEIKGVIRGAFQADKTALCGDFLAVGRRRCIGRHGLNLLFGYILHNTSIPF